MISQQPTAVVAPRFLATRRTKAGSSSLLPNWSILVGMAALRKLQLRIEVATLFALMIMLLAPAAQAQWTETVLHSFCSTGGTDCTDGALPSGGVTADAHGNLYGSTYTGGMGSCATYEYAGCGTDWEVSPPAGGSGPWTFNVIYSFSGGAAANLPSTWLVFDSAGNAYGTTEHGGSCAANFDGTALELTPPSSGSGEWTETILHDFGCGNDGVYSDSGLVRDAQGNLYGTTQRSSPGNGAVYEVSPPTGGSGPWTENVLHFFCSSSNCTDGEEPAFGSLILDSKGNLYGVAPDGGASTTDCAGQGCGVVFELSPPASGSGAWTYSVLYSFCASGACTDGGNPYGGLVFDSQGNLYGTTAGGGQGSCSSGYEQYGCGVAFKLTPPASGSGAWTESVLYTFCSQANCADGAIPYSALVFDPQGNLYGTTAGGGRSGCSSGFSDPGCGVAFELTPPASGSGPWTETVLYSFCSESNCADGGVPLAFSGLYRDSSGNLYGITNGGGANGNYGTVYELSPGNATITSLTSSPNPSTGSQTIAFTATVTPAPTAATGLGSVKWVANGSTIGVIGLLAADKGVVTLNDWSLIPSATPYSVEATYVPPAGGTLAGSTSNTVMQTINIEPTSTTLSTSPNPSTGGQTVTFTATVMASNGATPAGTVAFKSGSSLLENVSLSSGMAVLNYANLIAGTDSITANYLGSNYMTASTSNVVSQVVSGYATSTALASTPNPSLAGHTVAFTATVTATAGGVPTGKVTFMNGATSIGTATLNGSGVAVLSYASLPAGTDSITATYTGSTTDVPSTSAVVSQVVNLASTTTKLSASPNPSSVGQAVAFTATVTVSGGGTATGTVTFRNGTATIGTATLNGSGVAVLDYAGLPVGTSSITAAYGGSTMDAGSTSAALAQVVNLDATSTVLTSSLNPSSGGQTVTFTATVSAALGSVPTGWVKFYNGTTAIGTLSLSSGVAKLNDSELGAGTHSITATYGGSGTDATSTSPVVSQVVNYDPTTTALTTSPNPSTSGASVTMTATVTPGNGVAAAGEVSFYSGSTLLGNVALSGGVATLSHAFTTGTYSLTAKYDGSQYKSGSTSNVVTQTVN